MRNEKRNKMSLIKSSFFFIVLSIFSGCTISKKTTQDEMPSNSFEIHFKNTTTNYAYCEESQTHDYSGNWDFDGDGKFDTLHFIGNNGAHLYYHLNVGLSSEKEKRSYTWLLTDFPLLESFDTFLKYTNVVNFVVHDFNDDGLEDIYLNCEENGYTVLSDAQKALGLTTSRIVISFNPVIKDFTFFDLKNLN